MLGHIWMCLFGFALARRVANSEHSCEDPCGRWRRWDTSSRCRFPHRCPARAAALQPPSTRRSTAAADEDVLLEFA